MQNFNFFWKIRPRPFVWRRFRWNSSTSAISGWFWNFQIFGFSGRFFGFGQKRPTLGFTICSNSETVCFRPYGKVSENADKNLKWFSRLDFSTLGAQNCKISKNWPKKIIAKRKITKRSWKFYLEIREMIFTADNIFQTCSEFDG